MANKLRALHLNRVDLVDEPANPLAKVTLFKSAVAVGENDRRNRLNAAAMERWGQKRADGTIPNVWVTDIVATDAIVTRDGQTYKVPFTFDADGKVLLAGDGVEVTTAYETFKSMLGKSGPALADVHVNRPDWLEKEASIHMKEHTVKTDKSTLLKRLMSVFKEAGALKDWAAQEEAEPEHGDVLAGLHAKLGKAIETYGDGAGLAAGHPLHALKALHKEFGDHLAACAKAAAAPPDMEEEPEMDEDVVKSVVAKALVDVNKKLADTQAELAKSQQVAKAAQDAQATEVQRAVLRKFQHIPVDVEKEAPLFKSLAETQPEAYAMVITKMNAAEEQAKQAGVIKRELGTDASAGSGATAWAQIEAKANEMVAKGGKMTIEKAINAVMEDPANRELLNKYYAEDGARG